MCVASVDRRGVPYYVRLKRAREASGKDPKDIAALLGISIPEYYDWENCTAELNMVASLAELSQLANILGIRTGSIFEDEREQAEPISVEQLCAKIKAHLMATSRSIAEFADQVGFEIEPALRDSSEVLKWNVDCLRFVCHEIGVDWLAVLP